LHSKKEILEEIHWLINQYFEIERQETVFVPGKTRIQFAGPVYDQEEIKAALDSLLSGWFVIGEHTERFERQFANLMGTKGCITVNSGSSALLLAWRALMNSSLENPLRAGDEIITGALTHTATVNSILLNGLKPVMIDARLGNYDLDPKLLEPALSDRTRGILPMHFLGNPCDMDSIMEFANRHGLYVVEDACDAYGAEYAGKKVGSFGDIGAVSFYTAHGITLGEGGGLLFNNPRLGPIIASLRAWGRACTYYCKANICKMASDPSYECPIRFHFKDDRLGEYDARYTFLNIGYNVKIVEVQAAFGLQQLRKFPEFIRLRNENFGHIVNELRPFEEYLILPKATENSKPVWFAIPLTIRQGATFTRTDLVGWLERHKIETRPFFAGYIPDQPAYRDVEIKVVGNPMNTKYTKENSFFIGCYPGINREMRDYIVHVFQRFFETQI